MATADDLLSDEDDPIIEDLAPETIEGVAARLLVSETFVELVYRECELDALWTLADVAVEEKGRRETGHPVRAWQGLPDGSADDLVMLRALLEQAHELAVDAHTQRAVAVLREAARLSASLS